MTKKKFITALRECGSIDLYIEAVAAKYSNKDGCVNWHAFIDILAKPWVSHATGQRILLY